MKKNERTFRDLSLERPLGIISVFTIDSRNLDSENCAIRLVSQRRLRRHAVTLMDYGLLEFMRQPKNDGLVKSRKIICGTLYGVFKPKLNHNIMWLIFEFPTFYEFVKFRFRSKPPRRPMARLVPVFYAAISCGFNL
jgi:hypothetical protein